MRPAYGIPFVYHQFRKKMIRFIPFRIGVPISPRLPIAFDALFSAFPIGLLTGLSSVVLAQTPPDAGALQREAERHLQAPRPSGPTVTIPAARSMGGDATVTRVTVRRLVIEGATRIPVAELHARVAEFTGQSLTFGELEQAAQRIAAYYRERGWFVRAYLPQQDVTDGTIRIAIVEGRHEGNRLENTRR